jgi:CBS domain-containing protein
MNKIGLVTKTVEDFTAHKYPRIPPITVTPHDTVAYVSSFLPACLPKNQVSQLFLEHKIHRIYVVDSDATGRPIGVIGLADYLALFLPRQ